MCKRTTDCLAEQMQGRGRDAVSLSLLSILLPSSTLFFGPLRSSSPLSSPAARDSITFIQTQIHSRAKFRSDVGRLRPFDPIGQNYNGLSLNQCFLSSFLNHIQLSFFAIFYQYLLLIWTNKSESSRFKISSSTVLGVIFFHTKWYSTAVHRTVNKRIISKWNCRRNRNILLLFWKPLKQCRCHKALQLAHS